MTTRPTTLSPADKLDWVRLIRSENVGPVTFRELVARYGTATAAIEALPELARKGGRRNGLLIPSRAEAERELGAIAKAGARLIALAEADYPPLLAEVEAPPPLISMKGDPALLGRRTVAIVGARNASAAGVRFARDLARDLGGRGITVVSGLARGIDGAAHEGSLPTGTAAVLAGGIDVVYPPEHKALQERVGAEGVLVAEMPVGTIPQARSFPRRNRIVAGLALGVVVVEAALKSGSLITARMAGEHGREVMAVPGSPLDPRCRGANDLIRNGAVLVESIDDVIDALPPGTRPSFGERHTGHALEGYPTMQTSEAELDLARVRIEALLGPTPVDIDELVRQADLTPPVVLTILLELELAGRLVRHAGNRVAWA
jgi:DNA processing protein